MVIRLNFRIILLVIFREIKDTMEISAGTGNYLFQSSKSEKSYIKS